MTKLQTRLAIMLAACACLAGAAQAQDSSLPAYQPQRLARPASAPYLLRDGSIYIVGDDALDEVIAKLDALFAKTHPGFKFTTLMKGSSTAIGGLTAGVSALGPMGRAGWPDDLAAFKETYGYEPTDIHIGYDSFTHPGHKNPPALYVNAANPLAGLSVEDAARLFTSGMAKGDLSHWDQLGLGGKWNKRLIHLYGLRDDGGFATSIRETMMGKHPFSPRYETFERPQDVIAAVSQDPYGIALMGFFNAEEAPGVKLVPLASGGGGSFAAPSYEAVKAGRYPFASYLRIYVNRRPGSPLDPFVKEYLRMVLSREGQAIIAAGRDTEQGFVPLELPALRAELAKLD